MKYRTSLQDIANKAGISKAAVSMALRNDPAIGAATRARVRDFARKLKYRPDPVLSRVAAQRWRRRITTPMSLMALVVHNKTRRVPDAWFAPAKKLARNLGYKLDLFEASDFDSPEHLSDVLYSRGVSGVIIEQVYVPDFCESFDLNRFTSVAAHLGYHRPPLNLVTPDRGHATFLAIQKVHEAGYTRVAVALLDEPGAIDFKDKMSAALFAKYELFGNSDRLLIRKFRLDQVPEFAAWIRENRPQAVLGFNNAIYGWLRKSGFDVPGDVAYVSLDTSPKPSPHWGVVISGVWPQDNLVLQTAVGLLDSQMRTHQTGRPERQLTVLIEGAWVLGSTFPPRSETLRCSKTRSSPKVKS